MKIREVLDKKIGDTEYKKYLVTLPKEVVQNSNLIGKELEIKLNNGKIIIKSLE